MKRDAVDLAVREPTGGDQAVAWPYASGMSRLRDLRAAIASSIGVGVEIGEISANGMDEIAAAVSARETKTIFVDSGAFNAFRRSIREGDPAAAKVDFARVFAKYGELSRRVLAAHESAQAERGSDDRLVNHANPSFVTFVAPDIVGDQLGTLELLEEHAAAVLELIDAGHNVIVPFQRGPLPIWDAYLRVVDILEGEPFIVGIPSAAAALGNDELREFLSHDYRPDRLHILGAIASARFHERMEVIRDCYLGDVPGVTADAMVMRSKLRELRGLAGEEKFDKIVEILDRALPRVAPSGVCAYTSVAPNRSQGDHMALFEYSSGDSRGMIRSRISREVAELLADVLPDDATSNFSPRDSGEGKFLEKAGISRWSDMIGKGANVRAIHRYCWDKSLFALVDGLPEHWWCDVSEVRRERFLAKYVADMNAAYAAFEAPPAMKRRLLAELERDRGHCRKPELRDLSNLKPVHGRAYVPKGGCSAKLKLKEAVFFSSEQAPYADHSRCLIPVVLDVPHDSKLVDVCRSNLAAWCEAIRTHNGFAGSGCSYSAELIAEADGAYVRLDCRASISD